MIKLILIIHDSMAIFKIGVVSNYVWSEWETGTKIFYRDRKWVEPGRDRRRASPAANSGIRVLRVKILKIPGSGPGPGSRGFFKNTFKWLNIFFYLNKMI